jgi:hypothetical protein
LLKKFEYLLLCTVGAITLVLVAVNIALYTGNRTLQSEVGQRANYIQQTSAISDLYQQLAKALAELAVKNHDDQLRAILTEQGFTISSAPTPPAQAASAAASKAKP